jgi:DNA-binding MarR family transcriptional regulator
MGMLERRPDPEDGRAKRVCYTNLGRQGIFEGLAILREEERAMAQAIGAERFAQLHAALIALEALLEPPANP